MKSASSTESKNTPPLLELNDVSISYEEGSVVSNVSIHLGQLELGAIVGPSGCGKSTLLRSIAGFEPLHTGKILMNGQEISTTSEIVNPENRNIGMVFQDVIMFPHMTIAENIAFGLRNWKTSERDERVSELLTLINLQGFENRYPHSLSGGEQQRVAIARSLARKPNLILLDEAFSNLDVELRQTLLPEVREILLQEKICALLVTHNQDEAFAFADKLGVMVNGHIQQWESPYQVYHRPRTKFIAKFIGEGVLVPALAIEEQKLTTCCGIVDLTNGQRLTKGSDVQILLRPDDILHDDESELKGKIVQKSFRGAYYVYRIEIAEDITVLCLADSHHNHCMGEQIGFRLNLEHVVLFSQD